MSSSNSLGQTSISIQIKNCILNLDNSSSIEYDNYKRIVIKNRKVQGQTRQFTGSQVNQAFYFNANEILQDDKFQFEVINNQNTPLGQTEQISVNDYRQINRSHQTNLNKKLYQDGRQIGQLNIILEFHEAQEIVGAVGPPNLSLAPKSGVRPSVPSRFALEKVQSKSPNFYSCLDSTRLEGWEFFPNKYKNKYEYLQE